ncbi:MAG: PilX N-terminal domain-containing pilus assembly protein [Gammaproteobacteria bacterium]|nr:PilX N-terminal domain-containing pilus assembly protein [Gammaproteobacteria bacterium]
MKLKFRYPQKSKQQGAALITALVFMGILTMLGISAMRSNTQDVKMHNAMKDRLNAFQCAEAALRQGELFISTANVRPIDTTVGVPDKTAKEVWKIDTQVLNNFVDQAASWWITNGWSDSALQDATDVKVGCAAAAQYIVQSMGGIGDNGSGDLSFKSQATSQIDGYRITSRSEGVSANAAVILQSTFTRQFQ